MLSSHHNLAVSLNQSASFKPSVNCLHRIFIPEGGDGFLIVVYKKRNWSLSDVWIILGCRENLRQARGVFQGLWCCYPWTFFHQPEGGFFLFLFLCLHFSKFLKFPVILMLFTCFICSPLFVTHLTCESGDCGTEACEWGLQKTASQNSILCCGLSRHNGEPFCGLDHPVIHFKGILKTSVLPLHYDLKLEECNWHHLNLDARVT